MADEETNAAEGAEKKKKGLPPFVIPAVLLVAGLGAGGFVGAKVVAPKLTAGIVGNLTAADLAAHAKKPGGEEGDGSDSTEAEGGDGEEHAAAAGGEHGPTTPPVYTMSDLVLNPAGSGGTRFLMMSVAFDMKDSTAVQAMQTRDAEIKDAVLALVGAKTVEELSEVSAREPLKLEIREMVGKITKKPKLIKRVSFPQFVIQ